MMITSCLTYGLFAIGLLTPVVNLLQIPFWPASGTTRPASTLELFEEQVVHGQTWMDDLTSAGNNVAAQNRQLQAQLDSCWADNKRKDAVIDILNIEINTTQADHNATKHALQDAQDSNEVFHEAIKEKLAKIDDLETKLEDAQIQIQVQIQGLTTIHASMTDLEMKNEEMSDHLRKSADAIRTLAEIGDMY
ncbi:hypothetical protein EKO04_007374 [Ascochyta lentis]|uniref:Uncharacterized protein n=1 Tax=Ascochyta lentis TaxID=205686 RepID=A0A8H7J3C5_9PLEO|nr:hypothetical protein EKO04_007374 [Ascochyta lentis]